MQGSGMFTKVLLWLYGLASRTGLLRSSWGRRAFTRAYFLYKRAEDPYARLVRTHAELFRGGDILDVGANIGYTALLFASAADSEAKVYAFEPDPENFAALTRLIERRGLQGKIIPVRAAVGENDGTAKLWCNPSSHADRRIWTKTLSAEIPALRAIVVTVPLISLDRFLGELDTMPSFIKIDVQGYELPVCLGLLRTLEASTDLKIAFEYDPAVIASHGFEPSAVLELFWNRGFFTYVIMPRGKLQPLPRGEFGLLPQERGRYCELIASRKALVPSLES
jgi:FkbM family methyltransferase